MSDEYDFEERQRALSKLRRNAEFADRSDSVRSDRSTHDRIGSRTSSGYSYGDRTSQRLSRHEEVPKHDFRQESVEQRPTLGSRISSGYGERPSQGRLGRDDELPRSDIRHERVDQHATVASRTSRTYGRQESDAHQQRQATETTKQEYEHGRQGGEHQAAGTRISANYGYGQQSLRQLGRSTELSENGKDHHHQNGKHDLVVQEEDIGSDRSSDHETKATKKMTTQKSRRDSSSSSDGDRKGGIVKQQVHKQESLQKQGRPPLQRDSTQRSVSKTDEDWAKRNIGNKGKVSDLISRFNKGESLKKEDARPGYKNDYGIGREPGQIRQDKWQ